MPLGFASPCAPLRIDPSTRPRTVGQSAPRQCPRTAPCGSVVSRHARGPIPQRSGSAPCPVV